MKLIIYPALMQILRNEKGHKVWFFAPASESKLLRQNSDNLSAVFAYFEITSIQFLGISD